ncbi:pentatricopeptide repeat-containing protein 1, mitochondrial isoform X1 [Chironomus tepperi]|uniref:pentatricopeptide repeat-containing protein 1, mitochondrial isoform X1 n=1 Tax=Chironomus tepperi TaxID=113505 RepID=UPI00391F4089
MLRQCLRVVKISSIARSSSKNNASAFIHRINNELSIFSNPQLIQHARFSSTNNNLSDKISNDDFRKFIASQHSDSFGSLTPNVNAADDEFLDDGDIKEETFIKHPKSKSDQKTTKHYADLIKDHLKHKRIKEAIDVLEVNIKEDGFRPMNYIFNLLIDGCARVGYSKKAFNLFTRMRQRGLRVTGATYTSLFNACANSPYKNEGLETAIRLREIMAEKGYEPNSSNYHAMIKAFGRCGDMKTAFILVDEMIDKKVLITTETFNFLIQACASEQEYGFRHALLVWHKMYQKGLKPDIYSFNLMLRCCRDTRLGDVKSTEEVIQTILLRNPDENAARIEDGTNSEKLLASGESASEIQPSKLQDIQYMPNLIAPRPNLGNLIEIKEVKEPSDRFLLLGGLTGYLDLMKHFEVPPDLKTFTELMDVIPNTREMDIRLLKLIRKAQIQCDVDFFNILIKRRALRNDYIGAREVVDDMIKRAKLEPDIVTYGVLALTCQTRDEAWELINEMRDKGIKMNLPILGGMLKQACYNQQFDYILDILYIIKKFNMKPNDRIMDTVDRFVVSCNYLRKKDNKNLPRNFRENVRRFKDDYVKWKEAVGLSKSATLTDEDKKILKEKPWQQFKEAQPVGYEDSKNEKWQRKQKLKRNIKMIKTKPILIEKPQE